MDREEKTEDRWVDPQEKILEAVKLQTKCLRDVIACDGLQSVSGSSSLHIWYSSS